MEVCFHDGFFYFLLSSWKETSWVFLFLLRFCSASAASCQERLHCGPSVRTLHLLFFFQTLNTFRGWSCAENIPDICRALGIQAGIQCACAARTPAGKRKLVYIRVIPRIASMSAQWTCSGLRGTPAGLCPRKCASCFSFLLLFYFAERLVKISETISKCSIEDTKLTPSTTKPLKGWFCASSIFCACPFFFFFFF